VSEAVAQSPRRSPGRPRSQASHEAIVRATLELLLEGGYGPLTMEAVRARSGVGKATIYRRWASKTELVGDAIASLHEEFDVPDTGSLRGDFHAIAEMVRASGRRAGASILAPRLLAEAVNDPELHAIFTQHLVQPRREALGGLLRRAAERGEIRGDVDLELLIDLFAGPAVYRLLISAGDLSQMFDVDAQLDVLINGLRPPGAPRS
jgi:AcrR family transcriptional regulator